MLVVLCKNGGGACRGNAVIVKPSSDAPLTILKMGKLMAEAGLPEGVLQVITGGGATAGSWLCGHKDVRGITLTGSTAVGVQTAKAGAEHLAHVTLELGGNDAFIVLNDADHLSCGRSGDGRAHVQQWSDLLRAEALSDP